MHPKAVILVEDADDGLYSSSLSSAILPSMDVSDMFFLSQQSKMPEDTTPWCWPDNLDDNFQESRSNYSVGAGPQTIQTVTTTSPRQKHVFPDPPHSDKNAYPGPRPAGGYSFVERLPSTLRFLNTEHPPSPGCSKKARGSECSIPSSLDYLFCACLNVVVSPSAPFWSSQWLWLLLYFSFNLLLTLSNKSVLTKFPFPYTLTGLHTLCSTIGCYILRIRGVYVSKPLDARTEAVLVAFSILYAINIVVSNVSLQMVTVPFHQVIRAATPIFTILLSALLFNIRTKKMRILSLSPVIFGVIIATYGDYYFTAWGLFLTLLGTVLAALKTIYTNTLQSSTKTSGLLCPPKGPFHRHASLWKNLLSPPSLGIHPLDLLMRMSPLAFIQCVIYAQLSGELDRVRQLSHVHFSSSAFLPPNLFRTNVALLDNCTYPHAVYISPSLAESSDTTGNMMALLLNGCIAFGLNVVSLTANGKIGALSMTVAANVKQVLTILFAVFLFDLTITPLNALGVSITLLGGGWYAWGEYVDKQKGRRDR